MCRGWLSRAGPPPLDRAHPGGRWRDDSRPARQGDHRGGSDHRRDDEQGGGPQGLVARPSPRRAGELEPRAADLLAGHVGEDLGRLEGLLSALSAAYGAGARVTADDLAPYLGEAGNVPRYELTDAIDKGEPGKALTVLRRMLEAGGGGPPCRC